MTGVASVIGGAILGESSTDQINYLRVISVVIVGIGGSLVASVFVGIGQLYWSNIGIQKKQKILFDLLGIQDTNQKVAIIIPRFPKSSSSDLPLAIDPQKNEPASAPQPVESKCEYVIKDSRFTNRYSLAFDDIVAVRHIGSVFENAGISFPRLEFSDDLWNDIYNKNTKEKQSNLSEYSAFICIGLFSNEITMEQANATPGKSRMFCLSDKKTVYSGKRQVAIRPDNPTDNNWPRDQSHNWDEFIETDMDASPDIIERQNDFALIAKCKLPDNRPVIIIGGAKSRATRKAASFSRKNWQNIHKTPCTTEDTSGNQVTAELKNKLFAAIYSLDGEKGASLKRTAITIDQNP